MNRIFKSLLCVASTSALLVSPAITGLTATMTASAAELNIPASLNKEVIELKNIRQKALQEYDYYANNKCNYKSAIPADFKVLFVEARNVKTQLGKIARTTEEDERIFSQIPGQFEKMVEYLSDYNVNIITDTLYIDDQITATTDYPIYENVAQWIENNAPFATYDSVIVYTTEDENQVVVKAHTGDFGCPNTSHPTRDRGTGASYSWVPIASKDHIEHKEHNSANHLYSVDVSIHEWMHSLEAFRDISGRKVIMPSADITGNGGNIILNGSNTQYTDNDYVWDNVWPADNMTGMSETFIKGYEPARIVYARAFLNGTLYDNNNKRYVGMFPSFWKFFNNKTFLGEFYAQDSSGKYAAFVGDNGRITRNNLPDYNDNGYVFKLCYCYQDDTVHIVSKKNYGWDFNYLSTQLSNDKFTKISFNDSDTYYICNHETGKYLSYNASTGKQEFSDFNTSDALQWKVNYAGNNAFTISPKNNTNLRFDIENACNSDNTNVNLFYETGYDNAQTFQFRLNSDETYSIYPMLSNTRCINAGDDKLTITTDNGSNAQKWEITKVNGNKELFPGNYTIRNNSYYINAGSSYNLSLSNNTASATKWNIKRYPSEINADNFYLIKAANGRVLDLENTYSFDGNVIGACGGETGYATGQAWQFKLGVNTDGEYYINIIPLNTRNTGLAVYNNTVRVKTLMSALTFERAW